MSDHKSMDDWQLNESSESGDQWQLLDREQDLPENLQLQDGPPQQHNQWQPVAYEEEKKSSGGSWLLPTLIIIALLAVLGYIGWLAMNGFDFAGFASQPPAATESVAQNNGEPAVAVAATTAPAEEEASPTATDLPPTPTSAPAPTLEPTPFMVEQRMATIDSQYGLNARLEPNADVEVTQVLDDGTTGVIVDEVPGWVQIELNSGEQLWVSSEFVAISTEMIPGDPADAPVAAASPETPSDAPADTPTDDVTVIVNADAGINARSTPGADGDIIQVLPKDASFTATDVSDDGDWVQVQLEDGSTAWITTSDEFVTVNGDLTSLGASAPEAEVAPEEQEPEATPEPEPTVTPAVAIEDAMVTVDNLVGVLPRIEPSSAAEAADRLPGGAEAPAIGRDADSTWVQIELEDGSKVWVFAGSVSLNVDIDALPLVEP